MKNVQNQKGAMVVEIALVVVTLAALGFAVYTVNQSRSSVEKHTVQTSPAPARAPDPKNLKISQFGIQMTLPDGLEGLSYSITPQHQETDATGKTYTVFSSANLISKQLQQYPWTCESGNKYEIASIDKEVSRPDSSQPLAPPDMFVQHVGSAYFVLGLPNGGPCVDDPAAQKIDMQQRDLIQQAFKTIRPI